MTPCRWPELSACCVPTRFCRRKYCGWPIRRCLGYASEIKSILHALAILGIDRLNALIVTTAMRGLAGRAGGKVARDCWRHNLASAVIGERVAPDLHVARERGYISGLIHDIGRLALLRAFPGYEKAMTEVAEGESLLSAEERLYGMDHAETGRWLLSEWGCPQELQAVAGLHENPAAARGPGSDLVCLAGAASQLADRIHFSAFPGTPLNDLEQIVELVPEAASQVADLSALGEFVAARINSIELSLG